MRQAAEVLLRRAGDGDLLDAGLLRGHDVHDHAARVDREAARHVEPDPLDGHPALGHRAPGDDLDGRAGPALVGVDETGPPDRLLQRGPHRRVEAGERVGEGLGGDTEVGEADPVEALGRLDHGGDAAGAHVVADRPDHGQGALDVEGGARDDTAQLAVVQDPAPQVEGADVPGGDAALRGGLGGGVRLLEGLLQHGAVGGGDGGGVGGGVGGGDGGFDGGVGGGRGRGGLHPPMVGRGRRRYRRQGEPHAPRRDRRDARHHGARPGRRPLHPAQLRPRRPGRRRRGLVRPGGGAGARPGPGDGVQDAARGARGRTAAGPRGGGAAGDAPARPQGGGARARREEGLDGRAAGRRAGDRLRGRRDLAGGQRTALPTVVDASAQEHVTVFVSGGRRGLDLGLAPADLVRVTGAVLAPVARR